MLIFPNNFQINSAVFRKILIIVSFCFILSCLSYSAEMESDTSHQQKMTKSPTMAIVYSAICPGLGQIYVGQYWKAPLFMIGAGTLVYFIVDNNNKFSSAQKEYDLLEDKNSVFAQNLFRKKEFYRDNRDLSIAFLLGVYVLSAVDAYTNAHLYDFNVDDIAVKFNFCSDRIGLFRISVAVNF